MKTKKSANILKDESGIVSIVLTVFVMIVLSLVVLAFSQSSRREQRQALDRQLSSQAFYAAESGINDTINKIRNGTYTSARITDCDDVADANKRLDTSGTFSYSCILYDKEPPILQYSSVDTQKGEFLSLQTTNNDLNRLKISWNKSDGGLTFTGCSDASSVTSFQPTPGDSNCDAGMLRLTFMPVSNTNVGRDVLNDGSFTVFLRPSRNGSGVIGYSPRTAGNDFQGQVVAANCQPPATRCSVTINGMPSGGGIFLLMRSIYHNNAVDVEGFTNTGAVVNFNQAQVKIDSTGKASDVLRRLQVRMPLYEEYSDSRVVNALDIMSGICKQLQVYPPIASADPNGAVSGYANNSQCDTMDGVSSLTNP